MPTSLLMGAVVRNETAAAGRCAAPSTFPAAASRSAAPLPFPVSPPFPAVSPSIARLPVGTPIVEIGYHDRSPMAYPSYFFTMARRLGASCCFEDQIAYQLLLASPEGPLTRLLILLASVLRRLASALLVLLSL